MKDFLDVTKRNSLYLIGLEEDIEMWVNDLKIYALKLLQKIIFKIR